MPVTQDSLRTDVRSLFQNLGLMSISDEALDLCIEMGVYRLSKDRPHEANYSLLATGVKHNLTALITNWKPHFSMVRQVFLPIPDDDTLTNVTPLDHESYRTLKVGENTYIFIHQGVGAGGAQIIYTTPWLVTDVDGATTTTVVPPLHTALVWICAHFTALSMAGKAAGTTDKQAPVDFVNFTSKSDTYRRVAREYLDSYNSELGITGRAAPISAIRNFNERMQDGSTYMTHRPFGLR